MLLRHPQPLRLLASPLRSLPIRHQHVRHSTHPTITPLSGALGATITDVSLTDLTPSLVATLRQALLDHQVIFFRSQSLSAQQFLDFTAHFSTPMTYPFVRGIPSFPQIINVLKREHETTNFGGVWHSDTTYFPEPPMGSVLYALEVPPVGGDTLFANQYLAYEGLSDGMKGMLGGLRGVSSSAKAIASKTREDRVKDSGKDSDVLEAVHPVVRTHPETGRKGLYINVAHTTRFEGWTEDESKPVLDFLHAWQVKPEFVCRFRWEKGSLAFWDNRCTLHYPVNDYHGYRRSMWRITLQGDKPV